MVYSVCESVREQERKSAKERKSMSVRKRDRVREKERVCQSAASTAM